MVQFSTNSNPTTRENIANVYGAKMLLALIPLDLKFDLHSGITTGIAAKIRTTQSDGSSREVRIVGHISRPVVGEGRQTPDRQMFFVNSRPCGLPQIAKAINEVYKTYNITQSPFIFANLILDTNAYDVNVSPDKRTILLHDQNALLESLKASLLELFEAQDQSVPQGQLLSSRKLPAYKSPRVKTPTRESSALGSTSASDSEEEEQARRERPNTSGSLAPQSSSRPLRLVHNFASRNAPEDREQGVRSKDKKEQSPKGKAKLGRAMANSGFRFMSMAAAVEFEDDLTNERSSEASTSTREQAHSSNGENAAKTQQGVIASGMSEEGKILKLTPSATKPVPGVVQNAFDRMRPKRASSELATITIGNKTTITTLGPSPNKRQRTSGHGPEVATVNSPFGRSLNAFIAPGTQINSNVDETVGCSEDVRHATNKLKRRENMLPSQEDDSAEVDRSSDSTSADNSEASLIETESDAGSDDEFLDEDEKRAREEARVAQMVALAEAASVRPTGDNVKRAVKVLKGGGQRETTLELIKTLDVSVNKIERQLSHLTSELKKCASITTAPKGTMDAVDDETAPEDRLSLTVSKADFAIMRVIGQFNLGFILAVRPGSSHAQTETTASDELFIIDQHASDEKYNFESLQSSTTVQNQRLVQPRVLDLTVIEEEIILAHPDALARNGFDIEVDTSGSAPVGRRCRLVSLPMSKGVVFGVRDLEELLVLLGEQTGGQDVVRPSKVRKMFAMRACRSSIMVGKTLTKKQMEGVVRHMGEIDKPWNCPHGRPTMRHLFKLDRWEEWIEGQGVRWLRQDGDRNHKTPDWSGYLKKMRTDDGDG